MDNILIGITDCSKYLNYRDWVMEIPCVQVTQLSHQNHKDLELCDGFILTGGTDVHPSFYGSRKTDYAGHPQKFEEERDRFEIKVFESSRERDIPLLAICRGFQLVNCILGGNLRQDLGRNHNQIHNSEYSKIDPATKNDKAHGVNILEGTLLRNIAGVNRSVVNSAHHQAVNRVAEQLQINSASDDGVIEGLEWKEKERKPFLLCVQWHPERMSRFQLQDAPLSRNVRSRFLEEVRKNSKKA